MSIKRVITERLGDPAGFVFKGQYYDAGSQSKTKCTVCAADIRFCYILKQSPENRSVTSRLTVGEECFHFFTADTQKPLKAAAILLHAATKAEEADQKFFGPRSELRDKLERWRKLKRQAQEHIRTYHRSSGKEWLPEVLFELKVITEKHPAEFKRVANEARWYDHQAQILEEKLKLL